MSFKTLLSKTIKLSVMALCAGFGMYTSFPQAYATQNDEEEKIDQFKSISSAIPRISMSELLSTSDLQVQKSLETASFKRVGDLAKKRATLGCCGYDGAKVEALFMGIGEPLYEACKEFHRQGKNWSEENFIDFVSTHEKTQTYIQQSGAPSKLQVYMRDHLSRVTASTVKLLYDRDQSQLEMQKKFGSLSLISAKTNMDVMEKIVAKKHAVSKVSANVWGEVFAFLETKEILKQLSVNKRFNKAASFPFLWGNRVVSLNNIPSRLPPCVVHVKFQSGRGNCASLVPIAWLKSLDIEEPITNEDIAHLGSLQNLETLKIRGDRYGDPLTKEAAQSLNTLTELRSLTLSGVSHEKENEWNESYWSKEYQKRIHNNYLTSLINLQNLTLDECGFWTPSHLELLARALSQLTALKEFHFIENGTPDYDGLIANSPGMENLAVLELHYMMLPALLPQIVNSPYLKNLKKLKLGNRMVSITDYLDGSKTEFCSATLSKAQHMHNLEELDLSQTDITFEGIMTIATSYPMRNLTQLTLKDTPRITESERVILKEKLPYIIINF